jgi:site-specific DNA recombinase
VDKGIERLLTAYQEELLSLEQLRERMPMLRQRQQTLRAELQAITDQANDRAAFLRLAETLTAFLTRLRSAAETLSVIERQKIVRLLVKEILVGEDAITIRHSIPIPAAPTHNGGSEAPGGQNYLLCKGRDDGSLRRSYLCLRPLTLFRYSGLQPLLDQAKYAAISHAMLDKLQHPFVTQVIEEATNVCIEHPVHSLPLNAHRQRIQRLMRTATGPEPVGKAFEVDLVYPIEDRHHSLLNDFVF